MSNERRYAYRIDAPGRTEHGRVITFGPASPRMYQREAFTLADGTVVYMDYVGPVAP